VVVVGAGNGLVDSSFEELAAGLDFVGPAVVAYSL